MGLPSMVRTVGKVVERVGAAEGAWPIDSCGRRWCKAVVSRCEEVK